MNRRKKVNYKFALYRFSILAAKKGKKNRPSYNIKILITCHILITNKWRGDYSLLESNEEFFVL